MGDLLLNGQTATDDWQIIDDDSAIPAGGKVIIGWDRWKAEATSLASTDAEIGVAIPNDLDVAAEGGKLVDANMISIDFPAFSDGRGYSQARLLRERFSFKGQIRATGDVLADQAYYMFRCGFDALVPRHDQEMPQMAQSWKDFNLAYQPATCAPEKMGWQVPA